MGPGTRVHENIRNGVQPKSMVDKVAQAHDLRYGFARNTDDIRAADLKMVGKVKQIKKDRSDSRFNTLQADLIRPKIWLEDKGLLSRSKFASFGHHKDATQDDVKLMRAKLADLEQQGFGKGKKGAKKNPKAKKKQKSSKSNKKSLGTSRLHKQSPWIAHVKAYQSKHSCSYKEAMQKSKSTYSKH